MSRDRGRLRLVITPGSSLNEPVPGPGGWLFSGTSDGMAWIACQCPWWHRIPYLDRRIHADLP